MSKKSISLQRVKRLIKKLNPIDDIIFRKMAENREFCEEILRVFLQVLRFSFQTVPKKVTI